ncbi:C1qdc1 protein [Daphnia sinensis]|uniref:C1qdc1 protein n=1 Tax=Daphnia sinensis TaxID=1820382 RepID=A0AAD5LJP9_9CRUS|nr:C1qdc1 protein [Daphnia sinensis]
MKHSFVALFPVLTCIVYGQLPGNWNQYLIGFRPYVVLPPSEKNNLFNSSTATQRITGGQFQTQQSVLATIALVDVIVNTYIKDLEKKLAEIDAKLTVVSNKVDAFKCTCSADDPKTIDKIPSSCIDLKNVGNTRSGLYSIMGIHQVETVYCDFTKDPSDPSIQKGIGYQDIKSKPVYFYVQKTQKYSSISLPIPYERTIINSGEAMNTTTGKFTAPVNGTYFFSFTGLAQFPVSQATLLIINVVLYRNGQAVARNQLNEVNGINNPNHATPLVLQTALRLQAGDKIWMQSERNSGGLLYDDSEGRFMHFSGWLVEEEITTSL